VAKKQHVVDASNSSSLVPSTPYPCVLSNKNIQPGKKPIRKHETPRNTKDVRRESDDFGAALN